jgi:hypothetical protein
MLHHAMEDSYTYAEEQIEENENYDMIEETSQDQQQSEYLTISDSAIDLSY